MAYFQFDIIFLDKLSLLVVCPLTAVYIEDRVALFDHLTFIYTYSHRPTLL